MRTIVVAFSLLTFCGSALNAQTAAPLATSDLTIAGVAVDADSATVRKLLGPPSLADSLGWHYGELHVFFKAGRVAIISLTGARYSTTRGLKVGDSVQRVRQLYRSCFDDAPLVQICWPTTDFDERAITVSLREGRVHQINVGRIIEP